jgi:GAF domain-containing protein
MSRLFDFQNPLNIVIAAAVAILVVGLLLMLFLRLRRGNAAVKAASNLHEIAMEREWQFRAASEQLRYLKSPAEVAKEISSLFRECLSMSVIAIYAGREGDPRILKLFNAGHGPETREAEVLAALPETFPSSIIVEYQQPRLTRLSALVVGGTPDAERGQSNSPYQTSELVEPGAPARPHPDARVTILPWRGAFEWMGIVVAGAHESLNSDTLMRYREALTQLSDRLGVALELEQGGAELQLAQERATRSAGFYRSLITSLEDAAPLTLVAGGVAGLVGADSAALWRVDDGGSMLRMVGSRGLRATEFLPLPVGQGLAGTVAQTGEALALEDAPADPRCLFPRESRESGITSYLGVPVTSGQRTIAVVEVHSSQRRRWDETDVLALRLAATSIAEVVRSTDARGSRLRVENAYLGLAEAMQRLQSRGEVLEAVVEVLGHAVGVSRAIVVEINPAGSPEPVTHEYRSQSIKGAAGAALTLEVLARLASAMASGEPIAIADSRERSLLGAETAGQLRVLSELALPVKVDGKVRSIIYLHQTDRFREWERDEIEFAARVGRQLSLSLTHLGRLDDAARDASKAAAHIAELERRLARLERRLPELEKAMAKAREAEEQAAGLLAQAEAGAAQTRAAAEAALRSEAEVRRERDQLREDEARVRRSSQQLLEINRLKSDFITNAGRELESSLHSLIGFVEQLSQGIYGPLTDEQFDALRNIYSWARRLKSDVDWLIEYGSSRSRRLENAGGEEQSARA